MLGGGTQKCDRVPLLVMEGLGAGAPGARGTPKRPREEEEDPRQQEWEEELRQQAAAGWPELDPRLENHAADNDDAWSDAPTEPWGDDGADPDTTAWRVTRNP